MKKYPVIRKMIALTAATAMVLGMVGCGGGTEKIEVTTPAAAETEKTEAAASTEKEESTEAAVQTTEAEEIPAAVTVATMERPSFLNVSALGSETETPSVAPYSTDESLSNVVNLNQFYLKDEEKALLAKNLFVVSEGYSKEFFEIYETNRYDQIPNFVTVDSLMHTYHLYFSHLMEKTEKNHLAELIASISRDMLTVSESYYESLKETEWESAAARNVAFFAVAAYLMDENTEIPDYVRDAVNAQISLIMEASGITECELTGTFLDYSQFKPRGYYEGDDLLERYFRAMMWYGQVGFLSSDEDLTRSAVLMNLALKEGSIENWEEVYVVTSFFAGVSDDLTYYEYLPAIEAAYGEGVTVDQLAGKTENWNTLIVLLEQMEAPKINSIPTLDDQNPDTKTTEQNKGFRFMGQRFTMDAAVFQQLVYDQVGTNSAGEKRGLPDSLDAAAAFGSAAAESILQTQGEYDYDGYEDNLKGLQTALQQSPESFWKSSLYGSWLYTLLPLLETKTDGYPSFMQSQEWEKKNLESFEGSYTELKHDTVLYAKQVMVEMGGGPIDEIDDRGYVEPEQEIYARFADLAGQTSSGLESYGLLASEDKENLAILSDLSLKLLTISQKELREETLTDEEYELIRSYGGQLEHFWAEAVKEKAEAMNTYLDTRQFPAALVTDIATNSDSGEILQLGTGDPSRILVIVPVDGQLKICSGTVFSFYQFTNSLDNRLTDTQWREMMGIEMDDAGNYNYDTKLPHPEWTQSYRVED